MVSEGRYTKRYPLRGLNIKAISLNEAYHYKPSPIKIREISFTGCSLETHIPFEESQIKIMIGKETISLKLTKVWEKCLGEAYLLGTKVEVNDMKSYQKWIKLLAFAAKKDHQMRKIQSDSELFKAQTLSL